MSRAQDASVRAATSARSFAATKNSPTKDSGMPFEVGDTVCAKYEVESLLGLGSIGFVVSARRIDLGDKVALKFLRPESLSNAELVARFAQEARVAASIKSEHVAQVLDVGSSADSGPFIVMEELAGRDLGRVLSEGGPLPIPIAVEYALEICEALAAAHARGIVHRDIKPENLFLAELANGEDVLKVLDFGISKVALAGALQPEPLVRTSVILGSPVYMSPEQIRESADVDARTDIWSLGCVLYELLSGVPAFNGQSLMQLCAIILEQWPTPLCALNPQVTPELEAVVWRCLAKDPAERYQNVAELAEALGSCAPERAQIWVERSKFLLAGARAAPSQREPLDPPSSRRSIRASAPAPRSLRPTAIEVSPPMELRPRRPWKLIIGMLSAAALAAAWSLLPVTAWLSSAQPERRVSASQAPTVSPPALTAAVVASPPTPSAVPAPSARVAVSGATGVPPRAVAIRATARPPKVVLSAPKLRSRPAANDDEPDVGY